MELVTLVSEVSGPTDESETAKKEFMINAALSFVFVLFDWNHNRPCYHTSFANDMTFTDTQHSVV